MSAIETLYTSKWRPLFHPYKYNTPIGEYQVVLIKKDKKKKWCASYRGEELKDMGAKVIYLPLKHCSTSTSCIERALLEAVIWAEEYLGLRQKHHQVSIPKESYLSLTEGDFRFDWHDNRKSWGKDLIYMTVQDGEKTYYVVYYVHIHHFHEQDPVKWKGPRIDIGYYREDYFYFAYELLNSLLDKIHAIVNAHYKEQFEKIDYDIIYRQDYRTLVFE